MPNSTLDELIDLIESLSELEKTINKDSLQCFTKLDEAVDKKSEDENIRYVFSQNRDNKEIHINIANRIPGTNIFEVDDDPICGHVKNLKIRKQKVTKEDACTGERIRRAAAYGQSSDYEICGTCVSHLYHTDNEPQITHRLKKKQIKTIQATI